jgi:pimeloyl-ACP methyl ester carboxylesterase
MPERSAVVLLHGSADSPLAWQGVVAKLQDSHTVHAPPLPPVQTPVALDNDLPWLDRLLHDTQARVLAGHSYGALLALRWALRNPNRLDRLVLGEPIAWGIVRHDPAVDAKLLELARCLDQWAAGDDDGGFQWLVDYWNGAGFWQRLPTKVQAALMAGVARTRAEVSSGGADRTNAAELATLAVPTVVVAGEKTTAESLLVAHRLAECIPDARLVVLPGAGHQFLRSHAAEVARAIDFAAT